MSAGVIAGIRSNLRIIFLCYWLPLTAVIPNKWGMVKPAEPSINQPFLSASYLLSLLFFSLSLQIQTTSRILLFQLKAHFAEAPRGRLIKQRQFCSNYSGGNCTQFWLIAGHGEEMWLNLLCILVRQPRCWLEIDHSTLTFFFFQASCGSSSRVAAPVMWRMLVQHQYFQSYTVKASLIKITPPKAPKTVLGAWVSVTGYC